MTVTVRFAPSPTGYLHIGNARTALFNWFFARRNNGAFILRLDDTDPERVREVYAEAIVEDLAWLGIHPDRIERQSARAAAHDAAAERLKASGRLYPCYETPDELERKRKRQLARGLPPVYDRAALNLAETDRAAMEAEGRKPHWRFLLEERTIEWDDLVRGSQSFEPGTLSDPVLVRGDGSYLYTLPSVVDDIDMGLTNVIRGEDHVTNTAAQIQLFEALGGPVPAFAHHNLLVAAGGEGLSKRSGALSLRGLREAGIEATAVAALASLIGTSHAVAPAMDLDELVAGFSFDALSRGPARFDLSELAALSARTLHEIPFETVRDRLEELGVADEALWSAVRGNIEVLADVAMWAEIIGPGAALELQEQDTDFLATAAGLLPEEPWDGETWKNWTGTVKAETGRKGRELFHPLRIALTGREQGPELKDLLPLIGRAQVLRRLTGKGGRRGRRS